MKRRRRPELLSPRPSSATKSPFFRFLPVRLLLLLLPLPILSSESPSPPLPNLLLLFSPRSKQALEEEEATPATARRA
jgi:hypothetical protein